VDLPAVCCFFSPASCAANGVNFFSWTSWGYPFVYETYLYHLHRLDHRHNFSPYFYQIYLTHPRISTAAVEHLSAWRTFIRSPLTSFLTQLFLSLSSGLFFIRTRRDMIMGWFIQTATFVIFNKVCTSQVCAICYLFVTWIDADDDDVSISSIFSGICYSSRFLSLICRCHGLQLSSTSRSGWGYKCCGSAKRTEWNFWESPFSFACGLAVSFTSLDIVGCLQELQTVTGFRKRSCRLACHHSSSESFDVTADF